MRILKKYGMYHRSDLKLVFSHNKMTWKITGKDTFEERAEKTTQLLFAAIEKVKKHLHKNMIVKVNCQDYVDRNIKILAYSKRSDQTNVIAIPDFSFINWNQCGIDDYDKTCQEIVKASKIPPVHATLFWIGNAETHPTRKLLCDMSEQDNRIEAYGMSWMKSDKGQTGTKYVSLIDHTKYQYLIDLQGRGWSGRTKFLFFSGRPLFLVDRAWKEYWYKDIQPYVYYIPVKEDLSDLCQQLDWAETHSKECEEIAQNAQNFAIEHLTRESAINYLANILLQLAGNHNTK